MGAKPSTPTTENNEEESVPLCSILSDGSLRQQRVLGLSTSREDETLPGEVVVDSLSSYKSKLEDCTKMYEAVKHGDSQTLSILLTKYWTKFYAIESAGNTALHYAVISACHKGDTHHNYYRCIDVLMNCQQMKLNKPSVCGYTALGYALNDRHMACVERMLKHPSAHRLYLDYYPGDSEYTVREIIMQTYPNLHLPEPIMESLDTSETALKLLAALQHDDYKTFYQNLNSTNCGTYYDDPYHSYLLEIACQMKNSKQFVERLLEKGADPNIKNRFTCFPLLHATARSGNFEVLEILLNNDETDASVKDSEDRTLLHWLAGLSERERGDKYKIENCLKLLLKTNYNRERGVDDRDRSWNTALSIAVERGFKNRAMLLLLNGADVTVFGEGSKVLLSSMSSVLEEILDDCLTSNKEPVTSKDYRLEFEHRELLWILALRMAQSKQFSDLLRHPVISTFLNLKWQKIKWFFYVDLAFYVTFVLFLTAYILYSDSYNTLNKGGVANNTTGPFSFNDSYITSGMNNANFTSQPNDSSLYLLWLSLMALLFLLNLREMYQLIVHRLAYVKSLENWLEILLIIASFMSCNDVASMVVKLHFSAVALLLGWLELLLMTWRLPQLSVQQEMLKTVSLTFLKFMAGYILLLIAFALSFYILFKGSLEQDGTEMFANPFLSLLTTIVMFTGEFEASRLSFRILPYTSYVIFLIFVVLEATILLNLLNGLAVGDTGKIREKSETLSLVARAKLIFRIETLLSTIPECIKPSVELTEKMSVIYPNKRGKNSYTAFLSLVSIISKKTKLNKERESPGSQEKWDMFTEKLSALQLRPYETQQILMQILTRLDNRECETTPL